MRMDLNAIRHPKVRDLVESLVNTKELFEQERKTRNWEAILATIIASFPSERLAIMQVFEVPKPAGTKPPSGNVRKATPPVTGAAYPTAQGVNKGASRIAPAATVDAATTGDDCEGCGHRMDGPTAPAVLAKRPGTAHLMTEAGVMQAFKGDLFFMNTHAKKVGINVGNTQKPESLARKIAAHYKSQATDGGMD